MPSYITTGPWPDELIYSAWARYSDHVGYPSAGAVFEDLFGDRAVNPTIDLPCHLQKFCNNLPREAELDVDTIIDNHTLLPYYRPFLSPEKYTALRQQMIAGSTSTIHSRMGISTSYISRPLYLRYCPLCLERDKASWGESYWHRLHQTPGVEICPVHDVFLENSIFRTQSNLSQKIFASAQRITHPPSARDARSSPFYMQLKAIAENTSYLLNHALPPTDLQVIRNQYRALLSKQGYLTLSGIARAGRFLPDFQDYYSYPLLALLHCEIDRPSSRRNNWPILLVRAKQRRHPLYHILTLLFLGSSVQQFFQAPLTAPPPPFGSGPWPCLNPICPCYKQLRIQTCDIRQIGNPKGYSGVFTCDCGFMYSRIIAGNAPNADDIFRYNCVLAYGPLWEKALCEAWKNPQLSLAQIAQQLGVSTITIIRKVKALGLPRRRVVLWRRKSKSPTEAEITYYRAKWLKTVATFAHEGRYVVCRKSEGAYAWLKAHDKTWLDANLPPCKAPHHPNGKWPDRIKQITFGRGHNLTQKKREGQDKTLARVVRKKAQEILDASGVPQQVTRRKLRQEVSGIPASARESRYLPLTEQALEEVLESTEHFAIRRVQWAAQQSLAERLPLSRWELVRKAGVRLQQHKPLVDAAIQDAMSILSPLG